MLLIINFHVSLIPSQNAKTHARVSIKKIIIFMKTLTSYLLPLIWTFYIIQLIAANILKRHKAKVNYIDIQAYD